MLRWETRAESSAQVLSVPAGHTIDCIRAHHIHACPAHPLPYRAYWDTDYMAFRAPGGFMEMIYRVKSSFVLHSSDLAGLEAQTGLDERVKERVRQYITARNRIDPFKPHREPFRFYVLGDDEENIPLPHGPSPDLPVQGHTYYTVDELTTGKTEVTIASKAGSSDKTPPV